ncbi:MAG TPA: HAMP domain-containing sensor histidine kinase, partial [Flavitalea sp.]|nr:HAMP domain-containing sensor histidine kinase [Flavitalea sp.]
LASHEFRTPLSTVLSSAALIGRYVQTDDQDKREKHIKRIKDSVKHLNDILEDFLSLGKLEEGKIEAQPELFNVSDFLNDLMEEFSDLEKPGQRIQLTCEVLDRFVTDKKLLRNIVINLLGNAIKFSNENSTVQLEAYQQDSKLRILVKDDGIGISEADQDQLFDSFFRGKNASNIQGTGLGLHIVKKHLELLRGTISLKSVLDKGTTFIIEIPDLSGE